jgi:hypothetical protein
MQFTEYYTFLKGIFNTSTEVIKIPGSKAEIRFCLFESPAEITPESEILHEIRKTLKGGKQDQMIMENHKFFYPVFCPSGNNKNSKAILMLHGLNERKWDKYLTWAQYLTEHTQKAVILFPTSFHINRSPSEWLDPRHLSVLVENRIRHFSNIKEATYANLTLSERLTESPERFFLSGLQTANDIICLLRTIKNGNHPCFEQGTPVDLFAYSIGGLLAQVVKMANPDNLLEQSKLFLFCAGSVFENMNGVSRVILDSAANDRLHHYYEFELEDEIRKPGILRDFFHESRMAMAFRSMISINRYKKTREKIFQEINQQIYAIALKDDKVIPAAKIFDTLLGQKNTATPTVEVLHFDYPYMHEMPFPIKIEAIQQKVNEAFQMIFGKAAAFLA